MTEINSNLIVHDFTERAKIIQEIQNQCTRAEKGEKVALKQTVEKLAGLENQLNKDGKAIRAGAKITSEVRKKYDIQKSDLTGLNARVKALSAKANLTPAWVKPAVYTALTLAVLAVAAIVLKQTDILSSLSPPLPQQTTPTGNQSSTPITIGQLTDQTPITSNASQMPDLSISSTTALSSPTTANEQREGGNEDQSKLGFIKMAMNGYVLKKSWRSDDFLGRTRIRTFPRQKSKNSKSEISDAFDIARKKLLIETAKKDKDFPETEEQKSPIRDAFNKASNPIKLSLIETAKNGDTASMDDLEAKWWRREIDFSETEEQKFEIRDAYVIAAEGPFMKKIRKGDIDLKISLVHFGIVILNRLIF